MYKFSIKYLHDVVVIVGLAQLCGDNAEADLSAETSQRLLCQATGRTLSLQPITQVQNQGTGQAAVQAPIPSGMPQATGNSSSPYPPLPSSPLLLCSALPVLVFSSQSNTVLSFLLQIL